MNIKCVFIIFILIFATTINAQQKVIDSLEQQLINPTNGKTKVENLNWLGYYYARSNPEQGLKKLDESVKLAIANNDSLQLGKAYEYKGLNHKNLGNDSIMLSFFKKAEYIYRNIDSKGALPFLVLNRGMYYSQRSNYHKANEDYKSAMESFTLSNDTLLMGYTLGRIGQSNIYLGNYKTSLDAFLKGATLLELSGNEKTMHYGSIMGDLGLLYQKLSKYDTAIEYHNKCVEIYKKHGFNRGLSNQYNDIGNIYTKLGQFQKAMDIYKVSYAMKKQTNNKADIAGSFTNIGNTYSHLGDLDKALTYLDSANILHKELKDFNGLSIVEEHLGTIKLKQGETLEAKKHFDSAVYFATKIEDKRAILFGKLGLAKASYKLGNHKLAYNEIKDALEIKDSLFSDEKMEDLAAIKARYEYDKERAILEANFENDKILQEAEIEQQIINRNLSIGAGIFLLGIFSTGFIILRRKKEAELNEEIVTAELQKLRVQMNPHFIFNTLNSINDFVLKNEKSKASNYLARFSVMMRQILDNSEEDEVNLSDEITFLESYIKLEQQRLNNTFTYSINVNNNIDLEELYVPSALLQPIIENSIWHGLSPKKEGILKITFTEERDRLICTIEDNGVGLNPNKENLFSDKSFGTSSVKNRINLLNKRKGTNAKIKVIEKEEGICTILELPISKDV